MQADKLRELRELLAKATEPRTASQFMGPHDLALALIEERRELADGLRELLAIAEAAEDLRADWIQVPRQEFRAMLHYTECYADKFPSSGARETVADYFETLQRDAAISTVAPVREGE